MWRKQRATATRTNKHPGAEVLVALLGPVFLDDEIGGCSDDNFEPIPLMDEDFKETL